MRRQAHGSDHGINLAWVSALNPKRVDKHKDSGRMVLGHHYSPSCTCELRDEAEVVTW